MYKISIIMPVFNDEKRLDKSINSFLNQTLKDCELICVNDGSTDNSLEILNDYAKKYSRIKVFTQNNQGSGKARNYGMSEAEGEYIGFLDADDFFIDETALEKLYDTAIKNNADMVTGNIKLVNSKDEYSPFKALKYYTDYEIIPPEEYGIPWSFYKNIYKADFLKNNNILFPDLLRGQDPVFLAEILSKVNEIYTVPVDVYAYYYINGANQCNTRKKRFDHMMHYKMVFDYLSDEKFDEIRHKFRYEMLGFIDMMGVEGGRDILDATREIFKDDLKVLNDFENYFYLIHMNDELKNLVKINKNPISVISTKKDLNQTFKYYEIVPNMNQASGDYIYFINKDDEIKPNALYELYKNALFHDSDVVVNKDNIISEIEIGNNLFKKSSFQNTVHETLNSNLQISIYQKRVYKNNTRGLSHINDKFDEIDDFKEYIKNDDDFIVAKMYFKDELLYNSNNFCDFKINSLKNEISELQKKNNELKRENDKLNRINNEFINSKSWKVTKPLRKLKKLL